MKIYQIAQEKNTLDVLIQAFKYVFESYIDNIKKKRLMPIGVLKEYGTVECYLKNVKYENDQYYIKVFCEIWSGEYGNYGVGLPKNVPVYHGFVEGNKPSIWPNDENVGTHKDTYGDFGTLVDLMSPERKGFVRIGNFDQMVGNPIEVAQHVKNMIDSWGNDDDSFDVDIVSPSPSNVTQLTSSYRIAQEDPWWYDPDDESHEERITKYRYQLNKLKSINDVESLIPQMVQVAQNVYNQWDESNIDEYAGGGICHFIADAISSILNNNGIDCFTESSSYEQHVYCIVKVREGVYLVDIHHSRYETGGGFSWNKIPEVEFDKNDIIIDKLSDNFEDIKEYVEGYEEYEEYEEYDEDL